MTDHMNDKMVTVYSASDAVSAEVIANILRTEGIKCSVLNANQSGLTGLGSVSVEIMVREEDADRAIKCINESESALP